MVTETTASQPIFRAQRNSNFKLLIFFVLHLLELRGHLRALDRGQSVQMADTVATRNCIFFSSNVNVLHNTGNVSVRATIVAVEKR